MSFDALPPLCAENGLDFYTNITFEDGYTIRHLTIPNTEGRDEDIEVTEKRSQDGSRALEVKIGGSCFLHTWPDYFSHLLKDAINNYGPVEAFATAMANHFMKVPTSPQIRGAQFRQGLLYYDDVYKGAFDQRCSDIRLSLIQEQVPTWFPTSLLLGPETVWVLESPKEWQDKWQGKRRQTLYQTFHDVVKAKYFEIFPWDEVP